MTVFCSKYKERERGSLAYQARCVQSKTGAALQSPACRREALLIYRRPPPGHPKITYLIGGVHDDPTPSGSCSGLLSSQLYLANVVFRCLLHSRADSPTRFVRRNCGRRLPGCADSAGRQGFRFRTQDRRRPLRHDFRSFKGHDHHMQRRLPGRQRRGSADRGIRARQALLFRWMRCVWSLKFP